MHETFVVGNKNLCEMYKAGLLIKITEKNNNNIISRK